MKPNTIAVLGAVLLGTSALPAFAQSTGTDEGRPHVSNSPTRELTRMCRAEAKDKQLTGKERRQFLRDCQANQVAPEGSSTGASSTGTVKAGPDPDGRTPSDVNTSRINKRPPTDTRSGVPNTDAEGRPRPR